jgi:DNA-binding CsgD family transcriptional regulator
MGLTLTEHATAVLFNGLGRYPEAFAAARAGAALPAELAFSTWCLVQLVEAAVKTNQLDVARDAVAKIATTTQPSATAWGLGTEARCRALVSDPAEVEEHFRDALDLLSTTNLPMEVARTRLLYGEWLRHAAKDADARAQLRVAYQSFLTMGAEAFAERTKRELAALGVRVERRSPHSHDDLTAQEAQIARLASGRLTNSEIGAELFISARTVEWHLRKVYTKLGVSSRRELAAAFSS